MIEQVKQVLKCVLLVAVIALVGRIFLFVGDIGYQVTTLPDRIDDRLAHMQADLVTQFENTETDLFKVVNQAVVRTDDRTGQALRIIKTTSGHVDDFLDQNASIGLNVNDQLTQFNTTVATAVKPVDDLAATYTVLPSQISEDRVFKAYLANGLGLIAATKLSAGQAEKTMKVVADEAPAMAQHAEAVAQSSQDIAKDITREADQLTKPQTFWGGVKTWVITAARVASFW